MTFTYSLWDYPCRSHSGMDLIADPKLVGAKRCLTDGRAILCSPAMWSLFAEERDIVEREKIGRAIDVRVVNSLKKDWREAF